MNHPGIYFSILFLATLTGSIFLVRDLKYNGNRPGAYVCPPCGCSNHHILLDVPGECQGCGMPLIPAERRRSKLWEAFFMDMPTSFYHHKFFYPANFLALFICFFALFRFKRELPAVLFFVFFLSLALYSFKNQLYGTSYSMYASPQWAFFPISFLLAAGPALFLYGVKSIYPDKHFRRKDGLHFLPALIVLGFNTVCFFAPPDWRRLAIYNNYDNFPGLAEQLTFIGSGIFYTVLAEKMMCRSDQATRRFQKWYRQQRVFLASAVTSLAVMILVNLYYYNLMSTWLDYHPLWFCIAVFTMWNTYYLVFNKETVFQKGIARDNRLPDDRMARWKNVLENVMRTQKPYLNPALSLQLLAQTVGLKEKDLSEVLNTGFSKSFHEYVNTYRIEEVKRLLLNPEKQYLTNFAMAQEAGFRSRSAFFGLFKKYVGLTPGEFKQKQQQAG